MEPSLASLSFLLVVGSRGDPADSPYPKGCLPGPEFTLFLSPLSGCALEQEVLVLPALLRCGGTARSGGHSLGTIPAVPNPTLEQGCPYGRVSSQHPLSTTLRQARGRFANRSFSKPDQLLSDPWHVPKPGFWCQWRGFRTQPPSPAELL